MKLTASCTKLLSACERANHAVAKRSTLPILEMLLLKAENEYVLAEGTNCDWLIRKSCPATVEEPGAVCVSAKRLLAFLKAVDTEEVSIEAAEEKVKLTSGRVSVTLDGKPSSEFPTHEPIGGPAVFIGGSDFQRLVARTSYAVCKEKDRPTLLGLSLKTKNNDLDLEMCGADGWRVATAQTNGFSGELPFPVILPLAIAKELVSCYRDEGYDVSLVFARKERKDFRGNPLSIDTLAMAISGSVMIWFKCIEGTYPEYERVMPAHFTKQLTLDSNPVIHDIEMAGKISGKPEDLSIRMTVVPDELQWVMCHLDIVNDDQKISTSVPGELVGEPFTIGLDGAYLLDTLKALPRGQVQICVNTPEQPVGFAVAGDNSRHVLVSSKV